MRALLALLLLADGAIAAPAEPTGSIERRTLEQFATADPTCGEWSDGCAVCMRRPDRSFACSLPGIACEPRPVACRRAEGTPPR